MLTVKQASGDTFMNRDLPQEEGPAERGLFFRQDHQGLANKSYLNS